MVFGRVLKGLDVVTKVEGHGSQSGTTSGLILIAKSGELDASDFVEE